MQRPQGENEGASVGQRRAFGALRHPNFRLFWFGAAIYHIATWMLQVAQNWLIYDLTGSALAVGLTGLFLSVPFVAMSLYAGTVIDRTDRRKALIWISLGNLIIVVAIGLLVWAGWIQVWHIYASSVGTALLGAFESPARGALLPHLVPRADLMTAVSLHSVLRRGTQIVGPALGGIALAGFGVTGSYFLNAGGLLVLLLCLFAMRVPNAVGESTHTNPIDAIGEGLSYVRTHAVIGPLLAMETVMSFFGSFNPMLVVFAREVFLLGPQGYGLLQSTSGLGTVLGSLGLTLIGNVTHKGRLLLGAAIVYGASVVAFAFTPWFPLAAALLICSGAADIINGATRLTIVQLLAPGQMRGRVMSLHAISTRGMGPLGGFQLGATASFIGVQSAVALGGFVCIVIASLVAWRVRAVRQFTGDDYDSEPTDGVVDARHAATGISQAAGLGAAR
jgi:MFS family permease